MKLLSWNVFEIGNPKTELALRDLCWKERPNIVFLMETKSNSSCLIKLQKRCGFGNGVYVDSNERTGGLCLWWRECSVELVSKSEHHIEANVCNSNGVALWRAMGIYGWPEVENKCKTWDLMRTLKKNCTIPYIMYGDFNEILYQTEKDGGPARRECAMEAFRSAISDCGLHDLGYKGSVFTWQRGRSIETLVRERLDRFLGDNEWCVKFPQFSVRHLVRVASDHSPIMLDTINYFDRGKTVKLFRFEALWLSKEECSKVVKEAWTDKIGVAPHDSIAGYADSLSRWARKAFGDIKKKIRDKEKDLKDVQEGRVDARMLKRCETLAGEIHELRRME
ncbi:uncharacterized protein LOC110697550 [Chenopodium quinoa]|uniref:uncharacterized protein LOC110697550 n=1 Tax=Chenopodium quinoa TaxID=63459 RepID=UPI000B789193|nr:uncharacterized protein LOC110697550 [Chenopodium quinoa]